MMVSYCTPIYMDKSICWINNNNIEFKPDKDIVETIVRIVQPFYLRLKPVNVVFIFWSVYNDGGITKNVWQWKR